MMKVKSSSQEQSAIKSDPCFSLGWWEWWVNRGKQRDRHRKRWVRGRETGMRLMERSRKLLP